MSALDWIIVVAYLAGMIALSAWIGRRQRGADDYFVGGRRLPWWAIGLSTMATQSSTGSFLGIPAYVALREGGGLTWLQYELAVPIALLVVAALLVPWFRALRLVSVYEYLERRFSRGVRLLLSGVFQVSRALATGILVYAAAVVLAVCLEIPVWATILLIGVVTVIYDVIGGMAAVVWSDVIQVAVLLGGLIACVVFALEEAGGLGAALALFPAERVAALDFAHGLGDDARAPFWGFLVGGLFLYASYYGVDQSQVQRELAAPDPEETRWSLYFNAYARFPLTLGYLVLGVALGAAYASDPAIRAGVAAAGDINALVPVFIVEHLPLGLRALLVAALLAAAMSSLDSALNSLSAATLRDFLGGDRQPDDAGQLARARLVTLGWGVAITGAALLFLVVGRDNTVVEAINAVGSAFYGPILAAFALGILDRRANAPGVMSGVLAGVAFNLLLGALVPGVFFMWWNASGLVVAALVVLIVSRVTRPPEPASVEGLTRSFGELLRDERGRLAAYAGLVAWTGVILATGLALNHLAGVLAATRAS